MMITFRADNKTQRVLDNLVTTLKKSKSEILRTALLDFSNASPTKHKTGADVFLEMADKPLLDGALGKDAYENIRKDLDAYSLDLDQYTRNEK